jgi:hypothetical protein
MHSQIAHPVLILILALLLPGCVGHYGAGYGHGYGYGAYSNRYYGGPGYYGGYPEYGYSRYGHGYWGGGSSGYYGGYPRSAPPPGGHHFKDRDHDDHSRGNHERPRPRNDTWGGGGWSRPNQPGPDRGAMQERLRRQEAERSNHWQQGERRKQQEIQSRPPAFQPSAGQFQKRQEALWQNRQRSQQFAAPVDNQPRQGGGMGRGFKRNRRD